MDEVDRRRAQTVLHDVDLVMAGAGLSNRVATEVGSPDGGAAHVLVTLKEPTEDLAIQVKQELAERYLRLAPCGPAVAGTALEQLARGAQVAVEPAPSGR